MATRDRVRGMNAAFTTGQAGVGEMTPAKPPLRPMKLLVAVLVAGVTVGLGVFTYRAIADRTASFSGQITPAHSYVLNFPNNGTLQAMNVRPGEHVRAGQVLAAEDSTVDQANLKAAQAEVDADTAALAADQNPQVGAAQQSQNQLDVTKAQQAVSTAQNSLTLAQNTAQNAIAAQSSVVSGKQSVLSADSTRLTTVCTTSATPTPDQQASCAAMQSQIVKDQADLATAQAQLTATQSVAKGEQAKDTAALAASQATLAAAQNRANQAAPPVTPATIAQIQSDLANAQAHVAADQQLVREDTITAPADGIVADTAGAAGDVVGPNGVHGFNGPAAESGTLSAQQASGFQLFVQPAAPNGGSTQESSFAPVVVLFAPPMTVTAQLPEENMGGTHIGQGVTLDVTALGRTVHGTVSQILLAPARVPTATFYDVVIAMDDQPSGLLDGMTVQVTLN